MITIQKLEKEYQEFMNKLLKATKDTSDDFNNLSVQNQQRIKSEIYNNLPMELLSIIRMLQQ